MWIDTGSIIEQHLGKRKKTCFTGRNEGRFAIGIDKVDEPWFFRDQRLDLGDLATVAQRDDALSRGVSCKLSHVLVLRKGRRFSWR